MQRCGARRAQASADAFCVRRASPQRVAFVRDFRVTLDGQFLASLKHVVSRVQGRGFEVRYALLRAAACGLTRLCVCEQGPGWRDLVVAFARLLILDQSLIVAVREELQNAWHSALCTALSCEAVRCSLACGRVFTAAARR